MKRLLLLIATVLCVHAVYAQLLTWTPPFPKENEGLEIIVDATKVTRGCLISPDLSLYT
jgi:hypothetical protein